MSDRALSELISTVGTPEGKAWLRVYLDSLPFPHYEATNVPGVLLRIKADGTRTRGRFVGREWIQETSE